MAARPALLTVVNTAAPRCGDGAAAAAPSPLGGSPALSPEPLSLRVGDASSLQINYESVAASLITALSFPNGSYLGIVPGEVLPSRSVHLSSQLKRMQILDLVEFQQSEQRFPEFVHLFWSARFVPIKRPILSHIRFERSANNNANAAVVWHSRPVKKFQRGWCQNPASPSTPSKGEVLHKKMN